MLSYGPTVHVAPATGHPETRPLARVQVVSWIKAPSHKADWARCGAISRTTAAPRTTSWPSLCRARQGGPSAHARGGEYLILNEGTGTWQLGERTFPAHKSDILYVEPWVFHGLVNTGDKPLTFTVVRFNPKGVPVPPRPDSGKDER